MELRSQFSEQRVPRLEASLSFWRKVFGTYAFSNLYGDVTERPTLPPVEPPLVIHRSGNKPKSPDLIERGAVVILGQHALEAGVGFSISAIASSISLPMVGCLALACRCNAKDDEFLHQVEEADEKWFLEPRS